MDESVLCACPYRKAPVGVEYALSCLTVQLTTRLAFGLSVVLVCLFTTVSTCFYVRSHVSHTALPLSGNCSSLVLKYPGIRMTYEIPVTPSTTLWDIKKLVLSATCVTIPHQMLFLAGRYLQDSTFEVCGCAPSQVTPLRPWGRRTPDGGPRRPSKA